MKRRELLAAGAAALAAPWVQAQSSAWPNRPIRLMVQYPPGGLVDTVARLTLGRFRRFHLCAHTVGSGMQ